MPLKATREKLFFVVNNCRMQDRLLSKLSEIIKKLQVLNNEASQKGTLSALEKSVLRDWLKEIYQLSLEDNPNVPTPSVNTTPTSVNLGGAPEKTSFTSGSGAPGYSELRSTVASSAPSPETTLQVPTTQPIQFLPTEPTSTETTNEENNTSQIFQANPSIQGNSGSISFTSHSNPAPKQDLHQKITSSKSSTLNLNEQHAAKADNSLASKISKTRSMTELIDLNRRFLFLNELFKGNQDTYSQIIHQLDTFQTYEEALLFLNHLKSHIQLSDKNQSAFELLSKLVKQRFE